MSISDNAAETIKKLSGQNIWGCHVSPIGISLELGGPQAFEPFNKVVYGKYSLYACEWRIDKAGEIFFDSRTEIEPEMRAQVESLMNGQLVVKVELDLQKNEIELTVDHQVSLKFELIDEEDWWRINFYENNLRKSWFTFYLGKIEEDDD